MMMNSNNRKVTTNILADKICDMLNTAPQILEDDVDETQATMVFQKGSFNQDENIESNLFSNLKKASSDFVNDNEPYLGKKISRNSFNQCEEQESASESDSNIYDSDSSGSFSIENECSMNSPPTLETNNESHQSDNLYNKNSDIIQYIHQSQDLQTDKGFCVRNQINVWENLLEIRIQLQKCLLSANKLPQFDSLAKINTLNSSEFVNEFENTKRGITNMLNKLVELQKLLFNQGLETKNSGKKTLTPDQLLKEHSTKITSNSVDENLYNTESDALNELPKIEKTLNFSEQDLNDTFNKLKTYSFDVIQKWNNKTRIMSTYKNNSKSSSIVEQINFALNDKSKLIKKTRFKYPHYKPLFTNLHESYSTSEYDAEIFNDDDFYHQLLRDYIEFQSSNTTDLVELSRKWIHLQNLRGKMKRNIDTKATKGRKIKYVIHSKLVNFIAPVENSVWTEEAKTELYCSLFGNIHNKKISI